MSCLWSSITTSVPYREWSLTAFCRRGLHLGVTLERSLLRAVGRGGEPRYSCNATRHRGKSEVSFLKTIHFVVQFSLTRFCQNRHYEFYPRLNTHIPGFFQRSRKWASRYLIYRWYCLLNFKASEGILIAKECIQQLKWVSSSVNIF